MADKGIQGALSATLGALLFTIAGLAGYAINWHGGDRFGRQTGAPVLWEIGLGVAFAVVAAVGWRRAIVSPHCPPSPPSSSSSSDSEASAAH